MTLSEELYRNFIQAAVVQGLIVGLIVGLLMCLFRLIIFVVERCLARRREQSVATHSDDNTYVEMGMAPHLDD